MTSAVDFFEKVESGSHQESLLINVGYLLVSLLEEQKKTNRLLEKMIPVSVSAQAPVVQNILDTHSLATDSIKPKPGAPVVPGKRSK